MTKESKKKKSLLDMLLILFVPTAEGVVEIYILMDIGNNKQKAMKMVIIGWKELKKIIMLTGHTVLKSLMKSKELKLGNFQMVKDQKNMCN